MLIWCIAKILCIGECTLNFGGNYKYVSKLYLLAFDLTKSGKIEIEIPQLPSGGSDKLQSCAVSEVAQMNSNGYEIVSSHAFGIDSIKWKLKTFSLTVSSQLKCCEYSSVSVNRCMSTWLTLTVNMCIRCRFRAFSQQPKWKRYISTTKILRFSVIVQRRGLCWFSMKYAEEVYKDFLNIS